MERQLATLDTISDIQPIENADSLEVATVRGWKTVVRKGEFRPGDAVCYFEVDSALPLDDPRFSFLAPRGSKSIDGKDYHVLKTVRLRGQISQGLVLPAEQFEGGIPEIFKWEPPIPANLSGNIVGPFPSEWAPKTDAERIQNLGHLLEEIHRHSWVATEKIDGTSTTFINHGGDVRIASRNWELTVTDDLTSYRVFHDSGLEAVLPFGFAIQGELFGPGIQGNPLQVQEVQFLAFNLYYTGILVRYDDWPESLAKFRVPELDWTLPDTVEGILVQVDGMKSTINPQRRAEGVVWHCGSPQDFLGGRDGFKAISNTYLAKQKD